MGAPLSQRIGSIFNSATTIISFTGRMGEYDGYRVRTEAEHIWSESEGLKKEVVALVARAEAAERVIAEDRRDYVCGELHHRCAFEGRATVAEARVESARKLIEKWRDEGLHLGDPIRLFYANRADELEVALGVGGVEEKKA